jgi:phosphoglycolate phosphatase
MNHLNDLNPPENPAVSNRGPTAATEPVEAVIFDFDGTLAEVRIDFFDMKRRLAVLAGRFLPYTPEPPQIPALEWLVEVADEIGRGNGGDTWNALKVRQAGEAGSAEKGGNGGYEGNIANDGNARSAANGLEAGSSVAGSGNPGAGKCRVAVGAGNDANERSAGDGEDGGAGTKGELAENFLKRARALILDMELEAARGSALFPFSRGLLASLRDTGVGAGIVTRNSERAVRLVFPDLDDHCACFLAREHVPLVKPDPDHLLRALRALGVAPERALMVGDHPLDVEAGRRAGTRTAAVCTGTAPAERLAAEGPDWVASDCEKLLEILRRDKVLGPLPKRRPPAAQNLLREGLAAVDSGKPRRISDY